jgi:hemoglobin
MRLPLVGRFAAWMGILAVGTTAFAAEPSVSTRALDARIDRAVSRTISLGAPLYNQGDHAGCYRLYQGALLVIEPMLGHRDEMRQEVTKGLKEVEFLRTYAERANELRRVLDRVLGAVRTSPASSQPRPLWSRLGGEPAVKAVVHDFVALAANDPQVDFTRGGRYPLDAAGVANLERLLVELISAVAGGPLRYEGRPMKAVHQGMAITDAQFNALADDLVVVLKKYNVPKPEADELIRAIALTRKDIVEAPRP